MAPDRGLNTTGLAITTAQEFFVMYCITFVFLLLFLVPFWVQLVDNLCKLLCFNIFTGVFVKIYFTFGTLLLDYTGVVLLHCGCLSLNPFIEFRIQNNSSSSDVLYIQASISISPKYESK